MISIDSCFTFSHHVGHNRQVVLRSCWVNLKAVIHQSGCWEGFYLYRRDHTRVGGHLRSDSSPLPMMYLGRAWRQAVCSYRFISMRVLAPLTLDALSRAVVPLLRGQLVHHLWQDKGVDHILLTSSQKKGEDSYSAGRYRFEYLFVQHILVLQAIQLLQKDSCFDTNMRLHQKVII